MKRLICRHESNHGDPLDETFREYYEIYNDENGVVKVEYSGKCVVCMAGVDFNYEVEVQNWKPAPKCDTCEGLRREYNVAIANNLVISGRHVGRVLEAHKLRIHE